MVKLILKYLNKIKQFFLIIPILIGIMIFAGLFFASQKSQPEFATKAEQIMFDTKDKSPKFVMTLPEKKVEEVSEDDIALLPQKKEAKIEEENQVKPKTNSEKLNELDIPFLARLAARDTTEPLSHTTPFDEILQVKEKQLKLPVQIGPMRAWEVYGRKVDVMPMFYKVVVVVKNMGINRVNADLIIQRLPENVSLSFSPYAAGLDELVKTARENGHETYMDMILPSRDYLRTDSGPWALDFSRSVQENIDMLEQLLARNIAVGGFTICDGLDDAVYDDYFQAIMAMLKQRGLLMLDATQGKNIAKNNVAGLDRVKADIVVDSAFNRKEIKAQLAEAEQIAYLNGSVVIVVDPKPVAILSVAEWLKTFSKQLTYEEMKAQNVLEFEKPLILVPLSNLVGEY
ncbi:MAG: divergent polysaccharide deacetylase family protein [Alphaproteobacteria bacterium]|nr:divergent polysaccharide deacetylase family protein [Alphaproteobacteria bacterium]